MIQVEIQLRSTTKPGAQACAAPWHWAASHCTQLPQQQAELQEISVASTHFPDHSAIQSLYHYYRDTVKIHIIFCLRSVKSSNLPFSPSKARQLAHLAGQISQSFPPHFFTFLSSSNSSHLACVFYPAPCYLPPHLSLSFPSVITTLAWMFSHSHLLPSYSFQPLWKHLIHTVHCFSCKGIII